MTGLLSKQGEGFKRGDGTWTLERKTLEQKPGSDRRERLVLQAPGDHTGRFGEREGPHLLPKKRRP